MPNSFVLSFAEQQKKRKNFSISFFRFAIVVGLCSPHGSVYHFLVPSSSNVLPIFGTGAGKEGGGGSSGFSSNPHIRCVRIAELDAPHQF